MIKTFKQKIWRHNISSTCHFVKRHKVELMWPIKSNLNPHLKQGNLTEGEGSVQLTSQ